MSELRQLTDSIYCCKLEDPIPDFSGNISCFFLVNRIDNYDYAEALCKRLILAGCRYFHSFGRCSLTWDNAADWADISLGGLENEELFAMTAEEHDENEFREEIYHHYLEYNKEGHKYLLLYDDEETAGPIIQYVLDIYARDCKLRRGIALIEKTFKELGAVSEGEHLLEVLRQDAEGHYLDCMGPTIIKTTWTYKSLYYAVDTILYPENPCLVITKSESVDGPYSDLESFSYDLSDGDLKGKARDALLSGSSMDGNRIPPYRCRTVYRGLCCD